MQDCLPYETYLNNVIEVVEQLAKEVVLQDENAKKERNAVSEIEGEYAKSTEVLQRAREAVQAQYRDAWDSIQAEGIKRPREQRPAPTELSWKEAVRKQEQAAARVREWFGAKAKAAVIDRQIRKGREEAEQKARAAAEAEAARIMEEKKRQEEIARAADAIEALKRKFKGRR